MKFLMIFFACVSIHSLDAQDFPADRKATQETVTLYRKLKMTMEQGVFFGHQDDLAYGTTWQYQEGRSDIKDVTGDYPAVYGWELGRIETGASENLDGVPFEKMKQFIQDGYERGGIITISWHLNNPLTGQSAWEPAAGTVASILPGGTKNEFYKSWLNRIAVFMLSLKGVKGELIPVIFRPFHELNGNWFWWGKNHCTPEELKQLYQFTEKYLRDEKNIHNLLYAYNTDRFAAREDYLERYPGDEWVDVIGFDIYQKGDISANDKFVAETGRSFTILETIAKEKNKIPALTEFGYNELPDTDWWTEVLYKALHNHHIAYALAWRNAGAKKDGSTEYYVPFKGQASSANFKHFYDQPDIFFEKDAARFKLYQ